MDNTQATPYEIGYLAAMIDGEGCIAIQKSTATAYSINLKVTNTDEHIIHKVQSIMIKLGVNPLIRDRVNTNNPQWKGWMEVYLTKRENVKKILETVLPHLEGKRPRALMMLQFIDRTIDREEAFWKMKELNKKGKSSETTREAPQKFVGEDIVHTA